MQRYYLLCELSRSAATPWCVAFRRKKSRKAFTADVSTNPDFYTFIYDSNQFFGCQE